MVKKNPGRFRFYFNRLSIKFLIPLILVFLILLGTYTFFLVKNFSQEEEREFIIRFQQSLQLIANTSAGFLWNFNYRELEENMWYFFVNRELYSIYIVDDLGEPVIDLAREEGVRESLLQDRQEIFYDHLYLGYVEVAFTSHYYRSRVSTLLNHLLILSFIIFGVLISVIWFTSKLVITDPVSQLSSKLQQFTKGDFQTVPPSLIPVSITGREDELGVLARAFHKMSEKIRSMIRDLEQQKEKLQEISYQDNLTGLYNRTFLEEEIKRLDTIRQLPISLIMADINGLKLVNDTYGHEKGDELLVKTAAILRSSVRQEDLVARWAGDEFVILLPNTPEDKARIIFHRIEAQCQKCEGPITVSLGIGMAVKTHIGQDIYEVLNEADDLMYQNKLTTSQNAKKNLIKGLLGVLESKGHETEEHARRMEELALKIGEKLDLSHYDIQKLSLLATLHDIGKTTIAEEILTKPGQLTAEEWEIMKGHSEKGYHIASTTKEYALIAEEIYHHHEWWDGTGYPKGLKKEKIPLLARIIALVDAYDVMIHGQPYREALSREEAAEELTACAGTQFDPQLVDILLEIVA